MSVRSREWKLILRGDKEELYHLAEDPLEFRNLRSDRGASEHVARLKSSLIDELRIVGSRTARKGVGFEPQRIDLFRS